MNLESFSLSILSTLVSGVLLAVLFFWFREKVAPLPSITGRWYFERRTIETSLTTYEGMILRYVAMLWREGDQVRGTIEKTYEDSLTGKRSYVGENRSRGQIQGYVEKNYFGKDELYLHVIEDGHGRESTHFYELKVNSGAVMDGKFSSMVAAQSGVVKWQREEF